MIRSLTRVATQSPCMVLHGMGLGTQSWPWWRDSRGLETHRYMIRHDDSILNVLLSSMFVVN